MGTNQRVNAEEKRFAKFWVIKDPPLLPNTFYFLMTEIPFLEQIVTPANPGDPVQLVPRTEKTNKNENIFFSISLSHTFESKTSLRNFSVPTIF